MYSAERGFSLDEVLARLKANEVEAEPDDTLKDIANRIEKTPIEVYDIIAGKE